VGRLPPDTVLRGAAEVGRDAYRLSALDIELGVAGDVLPVRLAQVGAPTGGLQRLRVELREMLGLGRGDRLGAVGPDVDVRVVRRRGWPYHRPQSLEHRHRPIRPEPTPVAPILGLLVGGGPEKSVSVLDGVLTESEPTQHGQPVEPVVDRRPTEFERPWTVPDKRPVEPGRQAAIHIEGHV
jgi:hypothetical protein